MMRRVVLPLCLTLALSAALPAFAQAPGGDPKIAEAERGLLILGLYKGRTTGVANAEIARALSTFQQQQGLPVTGRPDAATLAKIQDKLPTQSLNNPKTGAPVSRAEPPRPEPRPQGIGEQVGVGANATGDAPREFNPVAGVPANVQPPPRIAGAAPRAAAPATAPVPLTAAPQEAVEASRVALPPGQGDGGFLGRALEEAQHGSSWLRWIWLPIAGLLMLLGLGAWLRAGKSSNPYLTRPGEPATRRREPTLER